MALTRAFSAFLPAVLMALLQGIIMIVGFVLLIVPGLILASMLIVSIPVLAREGTGVFASLSRSADLTKGARWPIFLMIIVFVTIQSIASGGAQLLAAPLGPIGGTIAQIVINTLLLSVSTAGTASIYHELRVQKEGVQTGELETVFA